MANSEGMWVAVTVIALASVAGLIYLIKSQPAAGYRVTTQQAILR
jgi:hypothetical protein